MNALSRVGPGVSVGVTESMIQDLVHGFYGSFASILRLAQSSTG